MNLEPILMCWLKICKASSKKISNGNNTKKIPVAYGLRKLHMHCLIEDEIVSIQGIIDEIHQFGEVCS